MSGATGSSLRQLLDELPTELAERAFSHTSWVERREQGYGRLAFLGDSVLGLAVASELFRSAPQADIGELTKVHNQAVSGRACANVARELDLVGRLRKQAPAGGSAVSVETLAASERSLASVCEAVIGACYLAYGYERSAEAVVTSFDGEIEYARRQRVDFKSELQERLARDGASVSYVVVREQGPPHERMFEVRAEVAGNEVGSGSGRSKKEAEQAAAARALDALRE